MPFSTIAGHQRIIALLSRAIAQGTLPPSLLLAGPQGIGKRRIAMAIAETLNCLDPASDPVDACGECAACRRIARNSHPDVLVIEPGDSGSIKIDQIREAIDRAGYRPFEGRRRVVIVDNANAMVEAAQNALLKTLEEPPSTSVFVLVSSMPDSLLPTVLSRCPKLRLAPLSPAEVAELLMRDHGYAQTHAHAVAADADGSIGRALESQSADVAAARDLARRLLSDTARLTDPVRRIDVGKALTMGKGGPGAERDQLAVSLRALSSLLRDLGILATHADVRMLANPDLQDDLARMTSSWDGRRSTRAFAAVDEALAALERNASPKVVMDWLALQL